jgi:hypothetical protein
MKVSSALTPNPIAGSQSLLLKKPIGGQFFGASQASLTVIILPSKTVRRLIPRFRKIDGLLQFLTQPSLHPPAVHIVVRLNRPCIYRVVSMAR